MRTDHPKLLNMETGAEFFSAQSFTGVAEEEGRVLGLYILHPNNVGRCGHICNASYAVSSDVRGKHERMVLPCKPILIKKGAWIGAGATILPGICIGEHAIVGAASVVTKDVPDCAVVVGNPAKVVKMLEAERFH